MGSEARKAVRPLDVIRAELNAPAVQAQLHSALPPHVAREKFTRVALTTIAQAPDLLQCSRPSLFRSIMSCAQIGLLPDAVLGEAYIVPYKQKDGTKIAQLQIGYKGLLKLARQSGQISTVETGIIASNDHFEWEMGLTPKFVIKPVLGDRGDPVAVYAIIRYKDGGFEYEVMTVDQVEQIRLRSPSRNSPAWSDSWGEMARKTVLRRILKKAPLSTEILSHVAANEALEERGEVYEVTDDGIKMIDAPEKPQEPAPARPTGRSGGRRRIEALAEEAEEIVLETRPEDDEPPLEE